MPLNCKKEVHPPLRARSFCVYSQCVVHIVVGPCVKGHFIHAGSSSGPGVLLLLLLLQKKNKNYMCPIFFLKLKKRKEKTVPRMMNMLLVVHTVNYMGAKKRVNETHV
jgi:hypothetical protein